MRAWPFRPAEISVKTLQGVIVIGGLAVIALVWAALSYHLDQREAAIRDQTHRDVRNLSIAVEKHVERMLVGVDQVLGFMTADFARDPDTFDFDAWLRRATSLQAIANQISMYNADGELLSARIPLAPGRPRFNIRDRAYFQTLSAHADAGLFIDRTFRGRITGRYVLQTARRLSLHDGSFAGVIAISVDPDYLSKQFEALDVGGRGSVTLFGHDGYVRARFPKTDGMYEIDATTINPGKGVFAQLKLSPAGSYEVESAFDHVTRIFGYRTVGSLPLVVTVGKSLIDMMEPLARERTRAYSAGLCGSLLVLALMLFMVRGLERKREDAARLALSNRILAEQEAAARDAEAQAQEANKLLRLAAQIAHVGHWRVELPSNRLSWSEEVFRIYGLEGPMAPPIEAAIAAYHPDDRGLVAGCVEEAVRAAKPMEFSARVIRPDGSLRDVISRGLCEQDASGAVVAIFGTFMDVTELRHAERAVARSEAQYRLLADNSTDMIVHLGLDQKRLYVSPASRELLGFDPQEMIGTSPLDMTHPDEADGLRALFADLGAGRRERAASVHHFRHRSGDWVWVEASFTLLRGREGAPEGVVASVRNVTDRKRAEQALQTSEQRYRLLAENTSELIMLGHDDGRRTYISPASQRLLGFTPAELGAMRLRDYVHPDDLARLYATTRRLSAGEGEVACVYRALNKTTGWIWVEGTFRRIPEAGEDEPSIVATFRDVSERERQARLLEQARSAAEAGARAKTEFLANMSHELRTPLAGMLGVHDLLRSDPSLGERQIRLIGLAQESGRALLAIVNDILDFSKIEAGQLTLEPLPFSLAALIEGCRQLTEETVREKALGLDVVLPAETPDWLIGDETRLRQILLNLLTNAAKFTSQGTIEVRAGYDTTLGRLNIAVKDTGIGIPAEARLRLFERFSQADASTSRRYGGTGLGLAICKSLVALMGGDIGVESELGRGSTFWFSIPLPVAKGAAQSSSEASLLAAPAYRKLRLLVAEDNAVNQEVLRSVLEQKGHAPSIVGDGAAAVAAIRATSQRFDLVLMDMQMPGLDGLEATRAIRAWELAQGAAPTPIIALTANALAAEIEQCREAGMNAHVAKPIEWRALFATMDRLTMHDIAEDNAPLEGAAVPAEVLDEVTLEELAQIVGRDRLGALLVAFADETRHRLALMSHPDAREQDLGKHAHALVSLAGQLGFLELSGLCARIEAQAQAGGSSEAVGHLGAVVERALNAATTTVYARAA